jgi:DNA polymerase III subunit epsilon
MNFVAIDFETANASRSSPCAIGLSVIENGSVSKSQQWLIRPQDMRFDSFNVAIHGITLEMVQDQPEFDELWPELKPYLSKYPIVAHNASFDMSVLRKTLDLYELKYPKTTYLCSVVLAKVTWPGLPSYRLDCLAGHLGIKLKHHDAESDARGVATIVLDSARQHSAATLASLVDATKIRMGKLAGNWYEPCRLPEGSQYARRSSSSPPPHSRPELVIAIGAAETDSPLAGKHVVFTGELKTMTRAAASQKVLERGGLPSENINADTDYLVVGNFNAATMRTSDKSSKLKKAEQLAARGQPIEIIGEEDFLRLL